MKVILHADDFYYAETTATTMECFQRALLSRVTFMANMSGATQAIEYAIYRGIAVETWKG